MPLRRFEIGEIVLVKEEVLPEYECCWHGEIIGRAFWPDVYEVQQVGQNYFYAVHAEDML